MPLDCIQPMKCLKCDVCNTVKIDAVMGYQSSLCDLDVCKACCSEYGQTIISTGQSVGAIICEGLVADIRPRSRQWRIMPLRGSCVLRDFYLHAAFAKGLLVACVFNAAV